MAQREIISDRQTDRQTDRIILSFCRVFLHIVPSEPGPPGAGISCRLIMPCRMPRSPAVFLRFHRREKEGTGMDAVVFTKSRQEYGMLSGILADESPGMRVSQGSMDGHYHLEHKYDIVVVGVDGGQEVGRRGWSLAALTGSGLAMRW